MTHTPPSFSHDGELDSIGPKQEAIRVFSELIILQRTQREALRQMFSFMAVNRKPMQRAEKMEELQRRNEELEREVREGREKEEELKRELERLKQRLSIVEEAEEQLCFQLGELEAEAVAQARAYSAHVKALSDQLAHARSVLNHCHLQHVTVD